ncbi:putative mannosyltransferase [Serendipita vermifera]|nr:putative mannosyltransferase [Serendipita vermifera]
MSLVPKVEKPNLALSPFHWRWLRVVLTVLLLLLSGHFYLSFTNKSYEHATSLSTISLDWVKDRLPWSVTKTGLESDEMPHPGHLPQVGLANATFIMLVGDPSIKRLLETLEDLEEQFNHKYHYPYTFLSRKPFTEEFKNQTASVVSSKVSYGVIPPEQYNRPDHIDEEKASWRERVVTRPWWQTPEFRNENRFNSGFFFRHELTQKYRYYWRIEPGVEFLCTIDEDPFMYLQENNKIYGFTVFTRETYRYTAGLWETMKNFTQLNPQYIADNNAMELVSDDGGMNYNICQFWNSFEIADMDFWRSEAYTKYFEYLDASGGFYYNYWGYGPVQSIGVSLFARKDQIHFFKEIGYQDVTDINCPKGDLYEKGKCECPDGRDFDYGLLNLCPLRLKVLDN